MAEINGVQADLTLMAQKWVLDEDSDYYENISNTFSLVHAYTEDNARYVVGPLPFSGWGGAFVQTTAIYDATSTANVPVIRPKVCSGKLSEKSVLTVIVTSLIVVLF